MPYQIYNQNNSGGRWKPPGVFVAFEVQSKNQDVAADRLEAAGLYFDGCSSGRDCPCCGDRWYDSPEYYEHLHEWFGEVCEFLDLYISSSGNIPVLVVHPLEETPRCPVE